MKLNGNKLLITGATSGIGLAILSRFYRLGNEIIAVGRDKEKLSNVKDKFPEITTLEADLSNEISVAKLAQIIVSEHPNLNVLINNAGIQFNYKFGKDKADFDKIEDEIRVNFTSPLQLCFRLLPVLERQNESAIVNVSSGLGLVPKKSAPVYCGTKAGLHLFTKSLRYQLENSSIKVFEIIPPLVETPMTAGRGSGKISAEQLTNEFIKAFERNKLEVSIGKVKLLRIVQRISPKIADNILKNG